MCGYQNDVQFYYIAEIIVDGKVVCTLCDNLDHVVRRRAEQRAIYLQLKSYTIRVHAEPRS